MNGNAIIQDLSHDGRGIAKIDGKVVFVEGALPEEEVSFEYLKQKKDYDEARVLEIIKPSPYRQTPPCPHFGRCGGCSLQHLSAAGQMLYKEQHWLQLMDKMGAGRPEQVLAPLQANTWHYRRKARFGVKYLAKKDKTVFGFREKHNSRFLIDMQTCEIIEEHFYQHMPLLHELLNALPSKAHIAQLELAVGEETALVFRHLQALTAEDLALLTAFGEVTGFNIYLQSKGPDSLVLLHPKDGKFAMQLYLQAAETYLEFFPLDFIQVNASMNHLMIQQALELLELSSTDVVLDLFCGLGNFSFPLARRAAKVYGVEGAIGMIERAQTNAKTQGFNNLEFVCANLAEPQAIDLISSWSFNKILIDPPRDGAANLMAVLGAMQPERIVYVSCHPATLARDAAILKQQFGYRMVKGGIMDMFPHTNHIESMALFLKD